MISEEEFWRLDPAAKAESVTYDIERLIARAKAAGLSATVYILELAAQEARKAPHIGISNAQRNHQ
jgi:hypothetical protein